MPLKPKLLDAADANLPRFLPSSEPGCCTSEDDHRCLILTQLDGTIEGFPLTWLYRWQWRSSATHELLILTLTEHEVTIHGKHLDKVAKLLSDGKGLHLQIKDDVSGVEHHIELLDLSDAGRLGAAIGRRLEERLAADFSCPANLPAVHTKVFIEGPEDSGDFRPRSVGERVQHLAEKLQKDFVGLSRERKALVGVNPIVIPIAFELVAMGGNIALEITASVIVGLNFAEIEDAPQEFDFIHLAVIQHRGFST